MPTHKQGKSLVYYIYDATATAYEPIGCSDGEEMNEERDVEQGETKCGPYVSVGPYSASIEGSGKWVDELVDTGRQSHKKLSDNLRNETLVTWRRDTGLASPNEYEYGTGRITSVGLSSNTDSLVEYSYTLSIIGLPISADPITT